MDESEEDLGGFYSLLIAMNKAMVKRLGGEVSFTYSELHEVEDKMAKSSYQGDKTDVTSGSWTLSLTNFPAPPSPTKDKPPGS